MIVYLAISATIWYVLAADNAERIEEGKKINHRFNGCLHLAVAIGAGIWFGWENAITYISANYSLNGFLYFIIAIILSLAFGWANFISSLCFSRIVFDVSLNHHRELPIDYVSPKPSSIVDKFEKRIFGNDGWSPKILYFSTMFILLVK